jgi:predicted DNA-binding transcriptional regulator YafY
MSKNKLALLRFKTIDQCLRNRQRKWTLEQLVDAVSDALYEYEGIDSGVGMRTIQLDIQNMRSDKLGYNAPIVVLEKKYYTYEDKNFSITNANISPLDLEKISDVVKVLNQFKGFSDFEDVSEIVTKLENKIISKKTPQHVFIQFEKNDLLKGLEWLDPLLTAVKNKTVLDIDYQSFRAKIASKETVFPYLLKEYRNRWFLLCRNNKRKVVNILALDRVVGIVENTKEKFIEADDFEVATFFDNAIGVTKSLNQKTQKIVLKANRNITPYILTKPIHASQTVLKQDENELIFSIEVVVNFELEREVLGYGESLKVLSPRSFKQRIVDRIGFMGKMYEENPTLSV